MATTHAENNDRPPHLAHHFDSTQQQYNAAKLGMWVFLATEILMFGGLFCVYAVNRGHHPEVFGLSHRLLTMHLGAINTLILITSSLTMAWGVRAAQLGQKRLLSVLLLLTFLGGCGFMGIKFVEYKAKWEHSIFAGEANVFRVVMGTAQYTEARQHLLEEYDLTRAKAHDKETDHGDAATALTPAPLALAVDHSVIAPPAAAPGGLSPQFKTPGSRHGDDGAHGKVYWEDLTPRGQELVHSFFKLYFVMTGLHGIHVLVGMVLIGYLFIRSLGGAFGPMTYTRVDMIGLYWHLVDLIWIFLFPLFYLIH